MDTQNSNTLTLWENQCSACSKFHRLLAAKTREPWKKYDQAMATARDLMTQGTLELFAGDCPLEDADGVLASEQHLTVCHYLRCKSCGNLYYVGACIRGKPVFRRVTDQDTERIALSVCGGAAGRFSRISESSNHQAAVRQNRAAAFLYPAARTGRAAVGPHVAR